MEELKFTFWNVQHGHATHIHRLKSDMKPNGWDMVVDLGAGLINGNEFSPLEKIKEQNLIIDYLVITHPHKDHIEDILNFENKKVSVLSRPKSLDKDQLMENILEEDRPIFEKYFEINEYYCNPVSDSENPKFKENNGGIDVKTFSTDACSQSNINNWSIVSVIEFFGMKALIPGDNESCSWSELLKEEDFIEAIKGTDIFLAPHHGRESGYHANLFEFIEPKITIVSDGSKGSTDAVSKYTEKSSGWTVHSRDGKESKNRFCLTTRSDGHIEVNFKYDPNDKQRSIGVYID